MIRSILFFLFFALNVQAIEFKGSFSQGGLITGKVDQNLKVTVDGKEIKVNSDGYFIFGISRNRVDPIKINLRGKIYNKDFVKKVSKRKFKIQRIDGLPKRKVSPNDEDMKRIRKEGKLISIAKKENSDLSFFFQNFVRPVDGITTGVYGSQRILNGKPRRPHYGIDIAAPKGTKVKNSNSGKVVLANNDLFFTGGTIIIDHGHGLISIYSHLEDLYVKEGDFVKREEIIATVGSTGRSTGPHLDFRLYCRNIPVDPDLVIPRN